MTDFYDALDTALEESRNGDRLSSVNVVIEADFGSGPIRLWGGEGVMQTPDGREWFGFLVRDESSDDLKSAIQLPDKIDDIRSGTAVPYEFMLGYLDEEHYQKLRASDAETEGRLLTIGYVTMPDYGMRSTSDIGHITRLRMIGYPSWSERRRRESDGSIKFMRTVTIRAVNANAGRSRIGAVLLTPTNQKFRSDTLYNVSNDRYAEFVPLIKSGLDLRF